ncbi:hypothetical protein BD26P3_00028 [Phocaeicola phage BD26P3]|nr:hypothetical protein BD26P1_00009 [Phocaeicola phage BD26P1]WAX06090.1 hypothetical protein BD26P2_00043 [Phocaeicola phage BD26P2]WAX06124.1 hypothetical protein BD26P3_00028 [Phocaeicola phage BD26P3]WAX06187.1 hypothetical protein BD26P4_00043 [Phocaeicola phage BD26P4]WAX06221.1 hypothetical protein BD26P5_00028 [Phocaeicola phage BD26P5]
MKSNNGILDSEELEKRTKFWNKKTFRTFTKKELNGDSLKMQTLLSAMQGFTVEELNEIRYKPWAVYKQGSSESVIRNASKRDFEYAISIAPKKF